VNLPRAEGALQVLIRFTPVCALIVSMSQICSLAVQCQILNQTKYGCEAPLAYHQHSLAKRIPCANLKLEMNFVPSSSDIDPASCDLASMTALHASLSAGRRVILFGGQGASNLYSPQALSRVRESTRNSKTALALLSRCHAAFIDELQSLDQRTKNQLAIDPDKFCSPQDLLSPDESLQSHGLIQMIVIVLAQLLYYAAEIERRPGGFDLCPEEILEVNGFCSGLLTAAVVASSSNEAMFSSFGIQAFRLAFWL